MLDANRAVGQLQQILWELARFGLEPDKEEGKIEADSSQCKDQKELHAVPDEIDVLGEVGLLKTLLEDVQDGQCLVDR